MGRSLSLLNTIKDDALADKISTWLKAPDSSVSYNDACIKHQEETGVWFINGEPFSKWKRDRASFLCVYGKAGCGNTVLCSSIIFHVDNICQKIKSCACAFDGRDAQSMLQRHDRLIRSLIQQFIDQCDGIPDKLQLYGKGHRQPPTNALEDIIQYILAGFEDVYVIIDSLDECTEREELVAWINKVTSLTSGQLHLLSTSRPEKDIVDSLKSPHAAPIFVEDGSVKDIEAFIESKIQTDLRFKKWDKHIRKKIRDALKKGADGMFRWVALQLEELCSCSSARKLEKRFKGLPRGLDETYGRIILKIKEDRRDDTNRFLTWIAFSTKALTLKELAEVVAVDFEAPSRPTYDPERKYLDPKNVLLTCSSLIIKSEGWVHASMQGERAKIIQG